ncbi:MAG: hypothetical protein KKB70_11480 [Proteobacteria bacterium]|nr:hypothetical protein [Pseudomonadota bacterium]MBU1611098.1 hypothetical protein [Pseudomonadota bacterium]
MAYDIRMVKLISGDLVIGKWSEDGTKITDPAIIQTVPSQQGVQMMLLPFGYPFEQDMGGEVETRHVIYEYKSFPDELSTKYLEACSNLTLSTPSDLRNLQGMGGPAQSNIANLLKK